ncbi:protein kinase [Colwellia sp. BRX8-7]|jgi:serine/threonine protein kinase|uniref:serine/threonine-protein kinase n=1 Tax=Colwellia sp. BRX8-7 TaxID=2759833 RepID=UPI0015F67B9C|nr:serine/threonine-protein kinase [Colwellia sp. BRX8-7]MBA6335805.1 protein kinase [Colwellia sp. BRX8-7]
MSDSKSPKLIHSDDDQLNATQIIPLSKPLAAGECLVGRFEIESLQGQGRYGFVYRAYDKQLDTLIAIKVLNKSLSQDKQTIADFKKELLLVRQLSHPNIIRVHEYYQDEDVHFLTMDWISGSSLEEAIASKSLTTEQTFQIIEQLLDGLAFAEKAGVTHKDIKPENIMLDESGRLFIADFGLSAFNKESNADRVSGTPYYAPPEYLQTGKINLTTDLYAAGVVIFQLCCHGLPFSGHSIDEILQTKLLDKPKFKAVKEEFNFLKSWSLTLISPHPASRPTNINQAQNQYISLLAEKDNKPISKKRLIVTVMSMMVFFTIAVVLFLSRQTPIKANAVDHYAVAILPLQTQEGEFDQTFANYLNYQLTDIKNLRVIEQSRLSQLLAQLGITPPIDDANMELISDLLQIDVLISPQTFIAGSEAKDIQFQLVSVDGFNIQRETLIKAPYDEKDWQEVTRHFVDKFRQRLDIEVNAEKTIEIEENPLVDLFPIKTLILKGDFEQAQQALSQILAREPNSAQAWLQQGELNLMIGLFMEAEQAYSQAIALSATNSYTAKLASARLNDLAGKVEQAQADYLSLVNAFPYNTELKMMLSEFYFLIEQHKKMEVLLQEVVKIDPNHPSAWFMLGRVAFLQGDFEKALNEYFVKALVTAKKLKNRVQEGEALNAFGVVYEQLGETELAFDYYQQSLKIRRQLTNLADAATTMTNLAAMHLAVGEYQQTEQYLTESLAIYQKLDDQEGLSNTYNELGKLAEEQASYQTALENYRHALNIRVELNNLMLQAESMNNIGFTYFMLLDPEHALVYWRQSEQLYQQVQFPIGIIHVRQNLGQMELAKGNWRNAYHLFNNTLTDAEKLNITEESIVSRSYLTKLAFLQGNFYASIEELTLTYQTAVKANDVRAMAEFGLWLADWSLQLGDQEQAAKHLANINDIVSRHGNKEHMSKFQFLKSQTVGNLFTAVIENKNNRVLDHAHQSIYIRQLIYQAKQSLHQGNKDISAYLTPLANVDFSLQQYQYIEYLELLAVQQYFAGAWLDLKATLRSADILLRKMGDYWRSFQFDRLRAQLAIVNQQDPTKYYKKVTKKLMHLKANLPPEFSGKFIETQDYFELNDSLMELSRHDQ